ncbi:MAG TPA: hypothetical protein VH592_19930 [Gemmataceae bacterium]|jgi:hypothetical protein
MMRSSSKTLVGVVLACVLLSYVSGVQRPFHCVHPHNRNSHNRHRALVRLRRCRGDNPVHHPVRPCKNAMLPPDDDDTVDPKQSHAIDGQVRSTAIYQDATARSLSPEFSPRPLPTEVPRHQTLCILLI